MMIQHERGNIYYNVLQIEALRRLGELPGDGFRGEEPGPAVPRPVAGHVPLFAAHPQGTLSGGQPASQQHPTPGHDGHPVQGVHDGAHEEHQIQESSLREVPQTQRHQAALPPGTPGRSTADSIPRVFIFIQFNHN